jgi:two-component system OmpR family sensor kinase
MSAPPGERTSGPGAEHALPSRNDLREVRRVKAQRDLLLDALQRLMEVQAIELAPALREAADAISAAVGAEKVDVFLHDEASHSLVAFGVSDTPLGSKERSLGLDRLPIANGGRTVHVFTAGEEFMTGRADSDPLELPGIVGALGVRSTVHVPIEIAGTRRGALSICSTRVDAFPDHVLGFTRAIARWVGVIAHRAEIVERLAEESASRGRRAAAEELVTVVAHDLRNYIGPVHGRILMLKQRAIRERHDAYRHDAEAAERSVRRLTRVVSDLLDVGRIEQGLFEVRPVPLDAVALIREVAEAIEGPKVPITVDGDPAVVLDGDPVRLRQALDNLLSNASKYSPPGSAVRVDVSTQDGHEGRWATVRIADRGPGMDADLASRAFTRFARGPSSKGLGLGLYLAREIIVAHGGTLELATAPGQGSTFTLRLPAHAS